jgi:hypothetical protein
VLTNVTWFGAKLSEERALQAERGRMLHQFSSNFDLLRMITDLKISNVCWPKYARSYLQLRGHLFPPLNVQR